MCSFGVETVFVSGVIYCVGYTILTCEAVWASFHKVCTIGTTLPQFTGFIGLNVIASCVSGINNKQQYQFSFLYSPAKRSIPFALFRFHKHNHQMHGFATFLQINLMRDFTKTINNMHDTLFDLHTWFVWLYSLPVWFYLAWKSPTPMLLFSLVRTTAADSCGDGNATATATTAAKIIMAFILLIGLVDVVSIKYSTKRLVFAWKQLKMN